MTLQEIKQIPIKDFLSENGIYPVRVNQNFGMYYSPLREGDHTPSFKVDFRLNLWTDYGTGAGGSIIDLYVKMKNCSLNEAIAQLNNSIFEISSPELFSFHRTLPISTAYKSSSIQINEVRNIEHPALIQYLERRCLNVEIARQYYKEISFRVRDKSYFAVGLQNRSKGWMLRNEFFKGCSSQNISVVKNNSSNQESKICLVYEGMFDFLSHLTLKDERRFPVDCIILNSLSNLNKAINWIKENKLTPSLLLDNDTAGQKATSSLLEIFPEAIDFSMTYSNHKDLNEYLQSKSNLKNNPPSYPHEDEKSEQANSYRRKR